MSTVDFSGWLLDVYPAPRAGLYLWVLGNDATRRRLRLPFQFTFYVSGENQQLRELWQFLQTQPEKPLLERCERRDIFQNKTIPLLSVQSQSWEAHTRLFERTAAAHPNLTFYDADIQPALRLAATYGAFPLCFFRFKIENELNILELEAQETPWQLDPQPAPLKTLRLAPDCDPSHAEPKALLLQHERREYRFPFTQPRPLLTNLGAMLRQFDPDLLLAEWGDSWLLPRLLDLSKEWNIPLPLNRDEEAPVTYKREHSYFSYGQIIHRDRQVHLAGRWHIDAHNAILYHDYGIDGVLELARVSALPAQMAARVSPGTGISAMQMVTALKHGVLIPWHKQQAEQPKTVNDLLRADQGGLIFQPITGLHRDVAEIDFVSMYPSIIEHFNISPEVKNGAGEDESAPSPAGLIPLTLRPLLKKRLALKRRISSLSRWDERRRAYQAQTSAHKWLLVTCFGYLGYKNARFGRIEAHEAVTAHGREALLCAKEVAEDLGFNVLHLYVDGLWIQKPCTRREEDYEALLEAISASTGLPIGLEGVYRWVAFLPSKQNENVPVANRYFGVFHDGTLKIRGLEARRRDTPRWIAQSQMEILEILAAESDPWRLSSRLPEIYALLRRKQAELRTYQVSIEDLVAAQKLSRLPELYRTPSPSAHAAMQLAATTGKKMRPGEMVRFLYTLGEPGVCAWDLPAPFNPKTLNLAVYDKLLQRAALCVLQPFGVDEPGLRQQLYCAVQDRLF